MASGGRPEPPRVARRILEWVVGEPEAPVVSGELAEAFRARVARHGVRVARRWYRRQVAGFVLRAPRIPRNRAEGRGAMGWIEEVAGDAAYAVRGLRRRPTHALVAVLTLALGIGANAAIFTLLKAHFLAPLPYERPAEVVLVWETARNSTDVTTVAPGNYHAWRDGARSFADVAAYNVDLATLSDGDGPAERVTAAVVVPHFFDVLGVRPELGPGFDEEAARAAAGRLVILSHGLWVRRYGADPGLIGRDIRIGGHPHTVVGVLPASFRQPERSLSWQGTELWRPLLLDDQRETFDSRYLRTVARLAPGATLEQARDEMDAMAVRMAEAQPEANAGRSILVRTLDEYLLGEVRPLLLMLLAAGASVLLIVCANLANLTLARGEERRREFAVRLALGSGRGRMSRLLLVEGLVLALAGAAVGTVAVLAGGGILQAAQERFLSGLVEARVDVGVVGLTVVAALGAGVLFSLPLARSVGEGALAAAMGHGGERAGGRRGQGRMRNLLVVGQVALAASLLMSGALLTRSFRALVDVPPGFESDGILTFELSAPASRQGGEAVKGYFREIRERLEAIPGITGVGMISDMPFTSENRWTNLVFEDRTMDPLDPPTAEYHVTTPEYFEVMAIPLLAGTLPDRGWEERDPAPVVVNRSLADRFWPAADPVGATFVLPWGDSLTATVTGVVEDVLDDGFDAAPEAAFYLDFGTGVNRRMALVVEVAPGADVAGAIRTAVAEVDPEVPVAGLLSLDAMLAETVVRPRAASMLGAAFGLLALLVAAAGVYGVLSYSVESRTREMGIRSALGANGGALLGMILGEATRLLAVGLALGCACALLAGRALSALLFGVPPWDPVSLVVTLAVLGGVGTLAAWIPARRALGVDPREALRAE